MFIKRNLHPSPATLEQGNLFQKVSVTKYGTITKTLGLVAGVSGLVDREKDGENWPTTILDVITLEGSFSYNSWSWAYYRRLYLLDEADLFVGMQPIEAEDAWNIAQDAITYLTQQADRKRSDAQDAERVVSALNAIANSI